MESELILYIILLSALISIPIGILKAIKKTKEIKKKIGPEIRVIITKEKEAEKKEDLEREKEKDPLDETFVKKHKKNEKKKALPKKEKKGVEKKPKK